MQDHEISDIVAMAWCDKTSFEDITRLTGCSEPQVIKLMRSTLKRSSFKLWRKRVSGRLKKHKAKATQLTQPNKRIRTHARAFQ